MPVVPVSDNVTSSLPLDALVVVVLLVLSAMIFQRFLRDESDAVWLAKLLWAALVLHLLGSVAQDWVVSHIYNNVADYITYDSQGAAIASQLHAGSLSLGSLEIPGDGMVALTLGILYFVMTPDRLGGFLVVSWFAFLGLLGMYKAFRLVLPDAPHRRYGYLVFLMPSIVYWPSAAGKEGMMLGLLGLSAYGAARLFTHRRGGLTVLAVGLALGTLYRPHESLLLFAAVFVAFLLRRPKSGSLLGPIRWVATLIVLLGGAVVLSTVAESFLHISSLSPSSVSTTLKTVNTNTVGVQGTAGFGSSVDYAWSPSPLDYPKDIYIVLFQPLPWQASGLTQIASSLENIFLLGLIVTSWRRLRTLPRTLLDQPYVMFCLAFTLGFIYLFSSLGNLGLLDRERSLMLPFLFVVLSIPARPKVKAQPLAQRVPAPRRRMASAATASDLLR